MEELGILFCSIGLGLTFSAIAAVLFAFAAVIVKDAFEGK